MFGHRGDGQEVRHLRISGGLDIEELSPKDERSKLLREKLTIIQEAQVSAGFAAASNLQLLRRDALLRDFNFQPPVLSAVRTAPFEGHHVVGPEPNVLQARVRAIRQADRMTGSSVTFPRQKEVKTSTKTSSKKTAPRPSVFDRLGSPPSTTQRTVTQEPPFPAGAGRARPRPFQGSKKCGKFSSSSAAKKRWRVPGGGSPGRLCPTLAESAGQLPGHRHRRGRCGHCIPATTSAHPSKHQFPDQVQPTRPSTGHRCLADKGGHRACHQREVPGFLQSVVSGTQEDRRSATCDRPVHSQPPYGGSTLQDGDARVRPISHQKSGVGRVDRHTRPPLGMTTWLPGEESATDAGAWLDHSTWDCSLECAGTGAYVTSRAAAEALHSGLGKNPGGPAANVHSLDRSIRDIMRSHISRWIVETVKEAYTQADRQYDRVTAHEVRALSASWAYNCQVALPDILSAAFWRSSGVFQNSYLRDMACIAEGMSTLGPVVVAQHVVDPGHLHPPP